MPVAAGANGCVIGASDPDAAGHGQLPGRSGLRAVGSASPPGESVPLVISLATLAASSAAGYYLHQQGCEHEVGHEVGYYLNGHDGAGRWLGSGATALSLSGPMARDSGRVLEDPGIVAFVDGGVVSGFELFVDTSH